MHKMNTNEKKLPPRYYPAFLFRMRTVRDRTCVHRSVVQSADFRFLHMDIP